MKKEHYLKYIDSTEFKKLYEEWAAKGKPKGNNPLYVKVWEMVENSVKACIDALQNRYHCQYQDYDEKVLDSTILIMNKLINMTDTPKNIVSKFLHPLLGLFTVSALSFLKQCAGANPFENPLHLEYTPSISIKR